MISLNIALQLVFYLILFFSSILIYFLLFLIYSHFRTNLVNKRKAAIKLNLLNVINDLKTDDKAIKNIYSNVGFDAILELLEDRTAEDNIKLREYLLELKYDKYILKRLKSSNKDLRATTIMLIGYLHLFDMAELIKKEIYLNKDSIDIQYVGFRALAILGCDKILAQIFNDESIHINLTYRAFQNIFLSYSGNKLLFYEQMLSVKDKYVVRIVIKVIGYEKIVELAPNIRPYLNSDHKDTKISAIDSLGNLEDRESYETIRSLCKDETWEIRSAAIKAISQIDLEASVDVLVQALSDSQWWVRYNSASALVHYKDISQVLDKVMQSNDQFAKDILNYAIAKNKIAEGMENGN